MRAGTAGVLGVMPLPTHTSVMMARLGLDWSIAPPRRCARIRSTWSCLGRSLQHGHGGWVSKFAPFQGLLESGIAVGYVFLPGAQFVACKLAPQPI